MDGTNSSSRVILSKIFEDLIEWRKWRMWGERDPYKWHPFHLSVVRGYVLKLNLSSDSQLLNQARLLNDEPRTFNGYKEEMVESFMNELREILVVPDLHQLSEGVEKFGVLAAFVDLLLRLLHHRVSDSVQKGLRFVLAVLGDLSFFNFSLQHEEILNLLILFEAVADEAGSFVYLVLFKTKPHFEEVEKGYDKFMNHMNHLKDAVVKFVNLQQAKNATTRKSDSDSLIIMDSLLDDLEHLLKREDVVFAGVNDQLKWLQGELKRLDSSIKNSEMEELKDAVMRIRDVAYEAEYLINYFLDGDAPHEYFFIRMSHVIYKIKSIEVKKKKEEIEVSKFARMSLQNKRIADVEHTIVGFEDEANEVLLHLRGEADWKLVCIHGMPGVGKTTLAKKLYNHPLVKEWFDKSLLCVVTQKYDKKSLLIDIVVGLGAAPSLDKDEILNGNEAFLEAIIHKHLWGRRYLVVLDDVWSLDAWYELQFCFPGYQNGSRILFTSRTKDVAPLDSIMYELLPTTDEHCWEILRKKVFKNEPCPPHLLKIGKEIAESCRGLPLVVLLVVGILLTKGNEESTWKEVKGNLASYVFSDVQNNSITQLLEMSYDNLQDHLKPCFLYFGAFPGAKRIRVPELLKLWIAEGFVRKEGKKSPESIAREYLMELIDKSLVTVVERRPDGGVKTCVVHDLLHEFCLQRCQEEILHTVVDKHYSMNEKQQRLRIHYFVKSPKLPVFGLHIRSILGCFPTSGFLNMKLLKVLDLMGVIFLESLTEIKSLINLKHLGIGYGLPSQQPHPLELSFISCLLKLEFLIVKSQFYLVCTPAELAKMVKLRHVQVYTKVEFGEEDCSSSQDNNLEFLSNVTVSKAEEEQMLRRSPHLRRLKCKCRPFSVEGDGEDDRYPDFSFFTQLESLHMEANNYHKVFDISLPSSIIELTLYGLNMPWDKMSIIGKLQNLQDFKLISSFVGETWVTEDEEFQQLKFLTLKTVYELEEWRVESWDHFPNLQGLIMEDCHYLQKLPQEIGEISTLQLIQIKGYCQKTLKESAELVEQEQRNAGNEELKFDLRSIVTNTESNTSQSACSLFILAPLDW